MCWKNAFDVALVNAQHIKAVPGRQTDVNDCKWIADLPAYGLVRKSFISPPSTRVRQELRRYRRSVTFDRVAEVKDAYSDPHTYSIHIALSGIESDRMQACYGAVRTSEKVVLGVGPKNLP